MCRAGGPGRSHLDKVFSKLHPYFSIPHIHNKMCRLVCRLKCFDNHITATSDSGYFHHPQSSRAPCAVRRHPGPPPWRPLIGLIQMEWLSRRPSCLASGTWAVLLKFTHGLHCSREQLLLLLSSICRVAMPNDTLSIHQLVGISVVSSLEWLWIKVLRTFIYSVWKNC